MTMLLAVLLGIFLRVYNIGNTFLFEGELGRELLYLRQYSLIGRLPLVGMPTSHEWLSYGPFYYWIMMPVFRIFDGNPLILFWTALIISVIGLILNYYVVKKISDKKIASLSTLIQAISPILIWMTRQSKLHVFFSVLSPIFMYFVYLMWKGKRKWIFWAGITFGFMFSFHFSQIPLFGMVILLFWFRKKFYKISDWLKFLAGATVPNITLLWHDRALAFWLPYRVLNLADKNPGGTLQSFIDYFGQNLFWNDGFWLFGTLIFAAIFLHYIWTNRKKISRDFLPFYLISSISLMIASNILHGSFPLHYFLPIFTIVPILYAIYLSEFKWGLLLIILFFVINIGGYFNPGKPEWFIPYSKQVELAKFIVADAHGKAVQIKRIGPYDYFPEQYSQNYKYLILWQGGNVVETAGNVYTITEKDNGIYVQK